MIRFDMLQQADPGQAFMQGYQGATQLKQQIQTQNALAAFAQNPDDPQALQALTVANPQLGLGLRRENRQEAYQNRTLDMQQQAAQQKAQQEQLESARKVVGEAALGIIGVPKEQQAQEWDRRIDMLAQSYPGLAKYRGQFSPTLLATALNEAGLTKEAMELQSGGFISGGEGSVYRTPSRAEQLQGGGGVSPLGGPAMNLPRPQSPQEAAALPPGAQYIAPDGSIRRKGGAGPQTPQTFPG